MSPRGFASEHLLWGSNAESKWLKFTFVVEEYIFGILANRKSKLALTVEESSYFSSARWQPPQLNRKVIAINQ